MKNPGRLFDCTITDFVDQVKREFKDYLPALRAVRTGPPLCLADFIRSYHESLTLHYLNYGTTGLILKTADPNNDRVTEWKIETETGRLRVRNSSGMLLQNESVPMQAFVESNILVAREIALKLREVNGGFGVPNLDGYRRLKSAEKIQPKEKKINRFCEEYEKKRLAQLYREAAQYFGERITARGRG